MVGQMMQSMGSPKSRKRTSSFLMGDSNHLRLIHTSAEKNELESILQGMGRWDFDVWSLVKITNDQPLLVTGMELIKRWHLDTELKLSDDIITSLFRELEKGYLDNPYHNNVHGADVMYTVHCLGQSTATFVSGYHAHKYH